MKIRNEEIKVCDTKEGCKTDVLEINYTHKGLSWKILIRDYKEELYPEIIKELRKEVTKAYNLKIENDNKSKTDWVQRG